MLPLHHGRGKVLFEDVHFVLLFVPPSPDHIAGSCPWRNPLRLLIDDHHWKGRPERVDVRGKS